ITQNPLTVSQGSAVTLSVTGNFSAYEWEINRVVISTGSTYTFNASATGSYRITVWVEDGAAWKASNIDIKVE
ncbi:MAG: hypothetical protein FWF29_06825, partial [Treponema sp.]|nr:hypothetical protein [Treponema sp.]